MAYLTEWVPRGAQFMSDDAEQLDRASDGMIPAEGYNNVP